MAVAKGLTAAVRAVNPQFALTFRPLVAQISSSLAQERLIALLAGVFGALALLLAGIGLYGVTAYALASRRTEIGIRMALGAPAPRVFSLVVTRTSLLVGAGVLLGTGASLWASRFVGTMVYGLEPRDPMTLVSAISLIVAVAALAASLPARRAVRIDPAAILRES
jgi:ABC-type antimicrobial peptide transport system permease subunit